MTGSIREVCRGPTVRGQGGRVSIGGQEQFGHLDIAVLRSLVQGRVSTVLRGIYPDRRVRCLLIWTAGPTVTPLSDTLLDPHAPGLMAKGLMAKGLIAKDLIASAAPPIV